MVSILFFKEFAPRGLRIGRGTFTRPIFNLPFQFQKRSQPFIRTHNVMLSVAAMHNQLNQPRQFNGRLHDAVIRVYDESGNVIETHQHTGDFKDW
jgi:hypothetical protein